MREVTWMLFLILPLVIVTPRPVQDHNGEEEKVDLNPPSELDHGEDEVISVSITSSVAVGRGRSKPREILEPDDDLIAHESASVTPAIATIETTTPSNETHEEPAPTLAGANIEFIKQLHSKKEARGTHHLEQVHPFQLQIKHHTTNDSDAHTSHAEVKEITDTHEDIANIPLGRSVALSPPSQNYIQGLSLGERGQGPRLTTVSFNILHNTPKPMSNYNERKPTPAFPERPVYSEQPKIYSQPAQVYSEPAKFYSEPAKIYSEPAKVYSEPAKVYSEPAKIYSEPAKFYSPHASLNLPPQEAPVPTPWQETQTFPSTVVDAATSTTTAQPEHGPEKNYEVDEKDSVLTDGQAHGVQEGGQECKDDSCKVGYVVEGRQYRKYRVEERTADGFIVGEYGVVRNEDGALRGVRYTADGDASPRLIYDALMKFLQL
ncbi:uncharacterized protein LOC125232577 [Leguminivora glycinivorella]|uniref:uncharacterized protein LOC125232577 n=1 Tax=Leguminivora glycinivorella TaxID=1035111 RepID=UPI00200FD9A4|nr:uncharacterized protein LOC125232577 [Leguminivora glycinivorella]